MEFFSHPHFLRIAGYPIATWIILYWIGQIVKAGIVFSEAKRLKLDKHITGAIFILQMIVGEFFSKIFFFLSHKLLHQDMHSYLKWENLGRVYLGGQLGRVLSIVLLLLLQNRIGKIFLSILIPFS